MTSVVYYQRLCTKNINKQLNVKCSERSNDLSGGQRDSIELIRGGPSYGKVACLLKIPKTTVYKMYDSRSSTENVKRSRSRKSLDDRLGRKIIRSLRADRKV